MANNISHDRLIQNEETFKQRNVDVKETVENIVSNDETISFVCECSDESCHEHIDLTPKQYETLHENKKHYVIKIGHDTPEVEDVINKTDTYEVVEKFKI